MFDLDAKGFSSSVFMVHPRFARNFKSPILCAPNKEAITRDHRYLVLRSSDLAHPPVPPRPYFSIG